MRVQVVSWSHQTIVDTDAIQDVQFLQYEVYMDDGQMLDPPRWEPAPRCVNRANPSCGNEGMNPDERRALPCFVSG